VPRNKNEFQARVYFLLLQECLNGERFFWFLSASCNKDKVLSVDPSNVSELPDFIIVFVAVNAIEL
jgi:hypothetical protein